VRRAYRIDVCGLHHEQVTTDVLLGDGRSAVRVVVVAVDPLDADRLARQQQSPVRDAHLAEADHETGHLDHRPVRVQQVDKHAVALRRLGRPLQSVGDVDMEGTHVPRPEVGRCRRRRVGGAIEDRYVDASR
jgi:hypothetical protein